MSTHNFDTQIGPLPEIVAYDTYFVDPHSGQDPYWDEDFYDRDKLENKDTSKKPNDQIENDDLNTDAHVSDAPRYTLMDLCTVNPHLPVASALPNIHPRQQNQQKHIAVIHHQNLLQLQVTPNGLTKFLPLSTILTLKKCYVSTGLRGVKI